MRDDRGAGQASSTSFAYAALALNADAMAVPAGKLKLFSIMCSKEAFV